MDAQRNDTLSPRSRRDFGSLLVEPFRQIKFGLYVIVLSVIFVVMTSGMFLYAFHQQYSHVMSIFNIADMSSQMELITNDIFLKNVQIIGIFFVLFIGVELWVVFWLTHRYYGPLVSIERFVEQVTAGQYDRRVIIRRKDELHRLVKKLNDMANALEKRHPSDASRR